MLMENGVLKNVLKAAGILFGGIISGAVLLILVYCLPVTEESANAVVSMEILDTEGWYPTLPLVESFEGTINQLNYGGILDNYTDSIMVSTAIAETNGRPWYQAMKMENSVMDQGYAYYWHGYVTILRPLLLLFDYGEIRVLNQMVQFLLVLALFCLIKRRKTVTWAFLSLSVYGLLFPMTLAYSLQYSWVFYIATAASLAIFLFEDFWRKNHNIYYLFLIIGMVTSYLDLLTYPLITWGIPIVWWLVLDDKEHSEVSRMKTVVFTGLLWILGYGGMWAGKWLLGQMITQEPVLLTAWREVLYRTGVQDGAEGSGVSHTSTILRNLKQCDSIQYIVILSAWFVWLVYRFLKCKGSVQTKKALPFFVVSVSVFVWYFVLHNHTFVHATFTYRIFTVFFAAILAALISATEENVVAESGEKRALFRYLVPTGLLVLSILLAFIERDTVWRHNGYVENISLLIGDGQIVEQELVPVYNDITTLQVGIRAEGALEGNFVVRVCREGEALITREIPTANVADSGFYEIPLNLRLKKGMAYSIQLYLEGNAGTEGFVTVTTEGDYTLPEFAAVSVNGYRMDAQMIGGLTYSILPGMSKLIINFLTAAGLLGAIYLYILNVAEEMEGRRQDSKREQRVSRNSIKILQKKVEKI